MPFNTSFFKPKPFTPMPAIAEMTELNVLTQKERLSFVKKMVAQKEAIIQETHKKIESIQSQLQDVDKELAPLNSDRIRLDEETRLSKRAMLNDLIDKILDRVTNVKATDSCRPYLECANELTRCEWRIEPLQAQKEQLAKELTIYTKTLTSNEAEISKLKRLTASEVQAYYNEYVKSKDIASTGDRDLFYSFSPNS